ncbi:MAG: sulfatase-like hydrolase/transferase [Acidobacteria bacterium]|nr:sulfatase-like hydrolase/transferase [Acidobacteriota bacterium]
MAHAGAGAAAAAPNPDRPNILFVLSDQYRYDALGANGNSEVHTPELDHLAASGVRFEHCYAAQALCTPSRASIMTGKYPHSHGL